MNAHKAVEAPERLPRFTRPLLAPVAPPIAPPVARGFLPDVTFPRMLGNFVPVNLRPGPPPPVAAPPPPIPVHTHEEQRPDPPTPVHPQEEQRPDPPTPFNSPDEPLYIHWTTKNYPLQFRNVYAYEGSLDLKGGGPVKGISSQNFLRLL
jgi:hypothetical protein